MYECKRCSYHAQRLRDLRSHLGRKKPCYPINDDHDIPRSDLIKEIASTSSVKNVACTFCKKNYATKATLNTHLKTCKLANKLITIKDAQELLDIQSANMSAPIVYNDNRTAILNNITFNDGGKLLQCDQRAIDEFFEHMSKDKCTSIAKMRLDHIPTQLMGDIFFNDDRKENMILAVLSAKNDQASVFEDGQWNTKDSARKVVTELFQIVLQKINDANDSIPRDEKINRSLYDLVQPYRLNDVADEIVRFAHYNTYKVEKVHGRIPRQSNDQSESSKSE